MEILNEIVLSYKPIFVFSKKEKYYPCSVEYITQHSQLFKNNVRVKDFGTITKEDLCDNTGDQIKVHNEYYSGDLNHAPVYYFIRTSNKFIDIVFFLFFAYNPPYSVLGVKIGEHDSDIEHVVVRVDTDTHEIVAMYYSSHGNEGKWVMKRDIKFVNTNPIVYVAKGSHAMYHDEGTHFRIFGFANDYTDFGKSWIPSTTVYVDENTPWWMKYNGKWSMNGISNVKHQRWWNYRPNRNSNFCTRFIPFKIVVDYCTEKNIFGNIDSYIVQNIPKDQHKEDKPPVLVMKDIIKDTPSIKKDEEYVIEMTESGEEDEVKIDFYYF